MVAKSSSRTMSTAKSHELFDKVLIANRGEIACRVMQTCSRLGIKTVAVFSDADRFSKHVQMADEAVHIGPAPAAQSYLCGDKIIAAALKTGAQAIHPGYGFLSENANFSGMCASNGVTFIGPPADAIIAMGSKSRSKEIMIDAKVPVTPGYHGADQTPSVLMSEAAKIGYPVLIKAVSGGGGKGMRLVWKPEDFLTSLESCQNEALKSFADDRVLLEKYVQAPRHIEFQIFADSHGSAVHLYERDCSVQRRHQKVLEEAPAPHLSSALRAQMGGAATAAALAVGYRGAGTVEFLFDTATQEFYFCEMNTRLQVEHPVTEMITGLDLVEWQLRVAAGEKLPLRQEDVRVKGSAIEARIYAENPLKGYLPATGRLSYLSMPRHLRNVRVDSGVREGDEVGMNYDPMIAKLVAWGEDRPKALATLRGALQEFRVSGLPNNIDFCYVAAGHPEFAKGGITTKFLGEHGEEIIAASVPAFIPKNAAMAAAISAVIERTPAGVSAPSAATAGSDRVVKSPRSANVWGTSSNDFRAYGTRTTEMKLAHLTRDGGRSEGTTVAVSHARGGGQDVTVSVAGGPAEKFSVTDATVSTDGSNTFTLTINGERVTGYTAVRAGARASDPTTIDIWVSGAVSTNHLTFFRLAEDLSGGSTGSSKPTVVSPMPGKVVRVHVKEGDVVKQGQPLMVLEAMKMEHSIVAPCDGVVTKLMFETGSIVSDGVSLAEVEPTEKAPAKK